MLHQYRFRDDGIDAAGAKELRQRYDEVNEEDNEIAHRADNKQRSLTRQDCASGVVVNSITNSHPTRSATCRRWNWNWRIIASRMSRPWRLDSTQTVSGNTGAVHERFSRLPRTEQRFVMEMLETVLQQAS